MSDLDNQAINDLDKETPDLQTVLDLDEIVHNPVRLAILIFLIPRHKTTFPFIRDALGLTGGNLSAHLKKLANSGFIEMHKMFVDAKPTTIVSISEKGRSTVIEYASNLSLVLRNTLNTIETS